MKRYDVVDPDSRAVGNVYEYRRRWYHNSSTGMHGPFASAEEALAQWYWFWNKDTSYFTLIAVNDLPSKARRRELADQFNRFYYK